MMQGATEIGRVISWEIGKRIAFRWTQAPWNPDEVTDVEIRCEESGGRTTLVFEHRGWGRLFGDENESAGWFAAGALTPLIQSMGPSWLGDWITDRRARRPSGPQAISFYKDPLYHYPGFRAILSELSLSRDDVLLEVGCGGGVLLREALTSGCQGAGLDHSPAMVRLAREMNQESILAGRLQIIEGTAGKLPFRDGTFTCGTMSGVFGFLPDPVASLRELRRVLRTGGRIVIMGSDPSMRGTPAAPEPMASRLRFYGDAELESLGREAGFSDARVVRRNLEQYAREAGVPEEHIPLFAGGGTPFLVAHRT